MHIYLCMAMTDVRFMNKLLTYKNDKCAQPKESCQTEKSDGFFNDLSQGGNQRSYHCSVSDTP